ncbi:MAG TPA: hypothetical protein ENI64_05180 [Gammaproteobacteria bacterium]|nr:hypothetical protein [Gammaproteobacteria bacterium]
MKSSDYQFSRALVVPVILILLLTGCGGQVNVVKQNEVPASVYRNSLRSIFSDVQSTHSIKQSIFKPEFLDYLTYLTQNNKTLDQLDLQNYIKRWNAVATEKSELVRYNPLHFSRVASLHNARYKNSSSFDSSTISSDNVKILQSWLHWRLDYKIITPRDAFSKSQLQLLNPDKHPSLYLSLEKLAAHPAGGVLVKHALDSGLVIRLGQLSGSHGYYNYNENMITVDPSVVNYEFNLRYLIHELLHACNTDEDNSITEEVIAELIGLDIQNQITGIKFEINPYLVFVEHVLHPEYGKLDSTNDIYGELAMAGIEL